MRYDLQLTVPSEFYEEFKKLTETSLKQKNLFEKVNLVIQTYGAQGEWDRPSNYGGELILSKRDPINRGYEGLLEIKLGGPNKERLENCLERACNKIINNENSTNKS